MLIGSLRQEILGYQVVKWCGQLAVGDVFAVDPDRLEQGLVEQPPLLGVRAAVGRLDAIGHGQRFVNGGEQLLVVDLQPGDGGLGGDALAPDTLLFFFEQLV